ncbi:MAG: Nif3-like dinuclear metal center hexameric protein [Bacteroidota bacterium]|nr:Nif3-like dinuclear metal center hexameric protein [Bacteroidota bacterium]
MKVKDIVGLIEEHAPVGIQEDFDNSGLLTGELDQEITGILVCLDVTDAVLDEAIDSGIQLIISHHPLIFKGIKNLVPTGMVNRILVKAIRHQIAIYSAHTNLDKVIPGVSSTLADQIELQNQQILVPDNNSTTIGMGVVGNLPAPMDEDDFLGMIKDRLNLNCIRHTAFLGKPVSCVAVCGGSGSEFLDNAISAGAEVFITGDFKYHQFFDADQKILIADIGHFESEVFALELLRDIVSKKFANFAVHLSKIDTNPIKYY